MRRSPTNLVALALVAGAALAGSAAAARAAEPCPPAHDPSWIDLDGPGIPAAEFEHPITGPLGMCINGTDGDGNPILNTYLIEQQITHAYTRMPDPSGSVLDGPGGSFFKPTLRICEVNGSCTTRSDPFDVIFFGPDGSPPPVISLPPVAEPPPVVDPPLPPESRDEPLKDCGTVKVAGRKRRVFARSIDCKTARALARKELRGWICRHSGGGAGARLDVCRPANPFVQGPEVQVLANGAAACSPVVYGGRRWAVRKSGVTCRYARNTVRRMVSGETPEIWEFTTPPEPGRWHCERSGSGAALSGHCLKRVENRWISFVPLPLGSAATAGWRSIRLDRDRARTTDRTARSGEQLEGVR
jgi:hypothetical protein